MPFFRLLLIAVLMMFAALFLLVGERLVPFTRTGLLVPFVLIILFGATLFIGFCLLFRRDRLSK